MLLLIFMSGKNVKFVIILRLLFRIMSPIKNITNYTAGALVYTGIAGAHNHGLGKKEMKQKFLNIDGHMLNIKHPLLLFPCRPVYVVIIL